ncbi:MAG: hypothetical protein FH748_14865 [Balneolaceae bacterium]|nr:hypothetical protein [Balneolaceae bacterium]
MQELPFNIPKSLSSYVEKFDDDPDKVIGKLKKHLRKRGPDAVGHFLLSWFYHHQGENSQSVREALKAKTYAPGSPLMEHLHYFLVHPEQFEAAIPARSVSSTTKPLKRGSRTSPLLNLDKLIALLEEAESQRITIPADEDDTDKRDLGKQAEEVDDVVSETLAKIHARQGRKKEAQKMYEKLKEIKPDKTGYFDEQIQKLENTQN